MLLYMEDRPPRWTPKAACCSRWRIDLHSEPLEPHAALDGGYTSKPYTDDLLLFLTCWFWTVVVDLLSLTCCHWPVGVELLLLTCGLVVVDLLLLLWWCRGAGPHALPLVLVRGAGGHPVPARLVPLHPVSAALQRHQAGLPPPGQRREVLYHLLRGHLLRPVQHSQRYGAATNK